MSIYHCQPPPFFTQANTVRQYLPLATMVMTWGQAALSALTSFVAQNPDVKAHTFKPLQGLLDWDYMSSVITAMGQPKATPSDFSQAVAKAVKLMWLNWHFHHPQLTNQIHPDRSMYSSQSNYHIHIFLQEHLETWTG